MPEEVWQVWSAADEANIGLTIGDAIATDAIMITMKS
jgi:hypothetical protein